MKGVIKKYQQFREGRSVAVDILVILFGVGAWVGVNGMFVQLPLLVETAPESWALPSFMSIAVQIANLGPLLYAFFRRFLPKYLNDTYWIYFLLFLGVISAILMAFYYDHVTIIGGTPRSGIFLLLVFFTAIVGCTSSVLFFPFMRHFKQMYLITYLMGEGLSGFLPSILALIQGVGGNPECHITVLPDGNTTTEKIYKDPLFSIQYFFLFIALILFLSFVSFIFLNTLRICKKERVDYEKNALKKESKELGLNLQNMKNQEEFNCENSDTFSVVLQDSNGGLSTIKITSLLVLMSVISGFANGVFPSIQSYSCLPYGNTAYHLAVTLSSMANPIACFLAVFLPHTSNRSIGSLSAVCGVLIAYLLTTSLMSPTPPLVDSVAGIVIVVLVWIFVVGLVSYIKLCISTIFRSAGGSWMFYCGSASQLGSAIGSLIFFFLINHTDIFVPSDPCR